MNTAEAQRRNPFAAHADVAYRIGGSHKVCQDYAIASGGGGPYVILSDGCSSSPATDVGARLLVHSAAQDISSLYSDHDGEIGEPCPEEGLLRTMGRARRLAASLGLDLSCLDATLLALRVTDDRWSALIAGDGVLARKDRDGRLHITSISYTESYPYYLNYRLDPGRWDAFAGRPGNRRVVEGCIVCPEGEVEVLPPETGLAVAAPYTASGCAQTTEWIAVLSDGVRSVSAFEDADGNGARSDVPLEVALGELLSFRATTGVFVQRRMQKFVQECGKRNWRFHDDLSLGAIAFSNVV